MTALIVIILALSLLTRAQAPAADLVIRPSSISTGESASLTWAVKHPGDVFISHLGMVGLSGTRTVHPEETTTYVLIAETAGRISSQAVTLTVSGARGADVYPDAGTFEHPLSSKLNGPSLPAVADRIHEVLQNSLRHTVRVTQEPAGLYRFVTNLRENGALVRQDEPRIAKRRVAFLVEVGARPSAGTFECTVKTVIQYQRRLERAWRAETGTDLYESQTRQLAEQLRQGK